MEEYPSGNQHFNSLFGTELQPTYQLKRAYSTPALKLERINTYDSIKET